MNSSNSPSHQTEYHDDEGRTFYHNNLTQETTWDRPYKQDIIHNDEPWNSPTSSPPTYDQETRIQRTPSPSDASIKSPSANYDMSNDDAVTAISWIRYRDDQGRPYYYNPMTQSTQWEEPVGNVDIVDAEEDDDLNDYSNKNEDNAQYVSDSLGIVKQEEMMDEQIKNSSVEMLESIVVKQEEEEKDETTLELENAQKFLQQPDAILEPQVMEYVNTLVRILGGQVGGIQAISSITKGYVGESTLCGMLTQWILEYQMDVSMHLEQDLQRQQTFNTMFIQSILEKVFTKLAQAHFTKEKEDWILHLPKAKRDFLKEMMEYTEWRRLLIHVAESTKRNSALMTFCLQTMTEQGYYREISKHLSHSADYFRVFYNMVLSEVLALGQLAVRGTDYSRMSEDDDSVHNSRTSHGLEHLLHEMKHNCSSSSYTYLYTVVFLRQLIDSIEEKILDGNVSDRVILYGVLNKWQRFMEDLEEYMIKPVSLDSASSYSLHDSSSESINNAGNSVIKKRRAHIALKIHDVQQKFRRRRVLNTSTTVSQEEEKRKSSQVHDTIASIISTLINQYSMGLSIDDHLVDQLLHNPFHMDENDPIPRAQGGTVGLFLCQQPLAISSLMGFLYIPGSHHGRSKSMEVKMKCAKLLALSVLSSESSVQLRSHSIMLHDPSNRSSKVSDPVMDEGEISKALLQSSQLLFDQVESMVSITVSEKVKDLDRNSFTSVGDQLSYLCIRYPIVARGFLLWAMDKCRGNDFASSAAYSNMAPGILSLARIISKYHPRCRHSVVDLAFTFLRNLDSELSYQKIQVLKEQALRLLLIVCTQGLVNEILAHMIVKICPSHGQSDLDSSLIRYFIEGMIDIVRQPFSLPFVRSMGSLLSMKACKDALNSINFDLHKKQMLLQMIDGFSSSISAYSLESEHNIPTTKDLELVHSLKVSYSIKC